jgi:hypothetical protein
MEFPKFDSKVASRHALPAVWHVSNGMRAPASPVQRDGMHWLWRGGRSLSYMHVWCQHA